MRICLQIEHYLGHFTAVYIGVGSPCETGVMSTDNHTDVIIRINQTFPYNLRRDEILIGNMDFGKAVFGLNMISIIGKKFVVENDYGFVRIIFYKILSPCENFQSEVRIPMQECNIQHL